MVSQAANASGMLYLIDISPTLVHSTQFNYIMNNISFKSVWDLGNYAGAIQILPDGDIETPSIPIKYPLDTQGNPVAPKV